MTSREADHCIPGVWRDKLSFTWDQRTFNFRPAILKAATDLLPTTKAYNFQFLKPAPEAVQPYPDFGFLQFVVSFETHLVHASAVIKAVYTNEGWSIYTMHTVAEQLKPFPERAPADGHMTGTTSWETHRAMEVDSADPEVLIIGGGQKCVDPSLCVHPSPLPNPDPEILHCFLSFSF